MCKLCDAEGALLGELERVILENQNEGHHKQYTVFIEALGEPNAGYRVMGRWGPIGKWQKSQEKANVGSLSMARSVVHELVEKKLRKGYEYRVCAAEVRP